MPKLKRKSCDQRKLQRKSCMREIREDESTKCDRQEKDRKSKSIKRQDKMIRLHQNNINKICQRKRLSIDENKKTHLIRMKEAQSKRLADEKNKLVHKKRLIECQRKRLSSDEKNKLVHKKRLIECQRKRLSINENRQNHQMRNREAQASRLADENKRLLHKKKLIECQRKRLSINENRQNHQMINREAQASRLADENKRLLHKKKLIECQRKRLSINENRQNHQMRNREAQASRLADENKRLLHKKKLIECQRKRLVHENNRVLHKIRLIESQKKRFNNSFQYKKHLKQLQKSQNKRLSILSLHEDHNKRSLQAYYNRANRNKNNSRTNLFEKYNIAIKDGPYWECVSCCRLLFRTSVTFCTTHMFPNVSLRFLKQCCVKMENDSDVGYLCSACKCSIKKNEKPRFSLCHTGLKFPHVSEEVRKLTPLEERFLCPRIPFMQIRTFGGNQQYSVKGRVVNVPTDVAENIEVLPRLPHETDVIPVVLKKKKEYKSNVMFQTVRPNAILDALKVLENCTVYKKANVRIDYNQINKLIELQVEKETIQNEISENESDSDSEDEPINIPADQTLLNSEAIVFAPGENFQPIPLFMDTDVEAMSFMKIYGGETKDYPNHLSYQEISKSEVMRSDKRVASSIEKLFFSCTYLRAQKVSNSISICMRKSSGKQHATVGTALADDFIRTITVHDSGYKIFAPDRGSPAFWEQKKKELFAMIRQLGPPTFFITLSPAETKWAELLVILKKVIDCIDISEDDALSMQYEEKVRLIKCDPVTCGLYFDYRLRKLISIMKVKDSIFREYELVDSYIRIEFQQRGSPHAHCLIWLKGAPRLIPGDEESMKECETFIDRFISCSNNTTLVSNELIKFQVHKHTFTCWKNKDEKKCRFGIPSFPMKETKILEPLGDSVNEIQLKKHKADFLLIRTLLNEMYQKEQELSFDEFLSKLNLSEESYILAIRSSLKRPKCFLKRSLIEIRINAYNPEILSLHRSNMDIQFITDVYSCAMYVLNYINKSKGGISKIIRDAMKEVKKGDLTLKEKLRFLANKFLNASEFSAQEAVYYLLSLPLSICSRSTVFINTSPPEKRVSLLKSKRELQQLPTECTDIYKKGVIDHYADRPDDLNGICLAEYAAYYNPSRSNTSKDVDLNEFSDHEIYDIEPRVSTETVKKRQRAKILRYVRYNIENDETNYYREQLMLFLPWRNEQEDVTNVNHKLKFLNFKDTIIGNRAMFIYGDTGDDIVMDVIDAAVNDHVATENENNEEDNDMNEGNNEFEILNDRTNEADIFIDTGIDVQKKTADDVTFPVPNLIDDESYYQMIRTLNKQQKKYLLHVLNCHKLNKLPHYECILGGAGVGKSRLIETLHQTLLRYYNSQEGTNLESLKVLICAPTGKAAFNIKGITLHSAFVLPLNQYGGEMPPLSSSISNTILSKLHDLKLIIIDEISMVGSKQFGQINLRLQQIFRSNELFARKSIIMFGDFNQLAPVGDKYIFKPDPSNPYSDLIGNPLWDKFTFFVLTEIMRQKDDKNFAVALNNLAEGNLTDEEVEMFNSRIAHSEPPETIRLYRSNAEVDCYNESVFRNQNDVISISSCDKVVGKVHETVKKSLLKTIKDLKVSSTYGLPKTLKLSIGVHYMVTNNIKVDDGLVNGAVGILKHIEKNDIGEVKRLWLSFSDPNVGKKLRTEIKQISRAKGIDESLTPIEMLSRNIKPRKNTIAMVMRRQFPIVPAEAITIYKSQGGTYNSAVVNLKPGMKRNELYVALSRVTSLNGLFIRGKFSKPQKSNNEVSRVIKSAVTEKPVKMDLMFLEKDSKYFSIVFHNVQSLRKHHQDITVDHFMTCATVIALVETWTLTTDNLSMNGYKEVYRVDVKKNYRHAYGILVYCKFEIATEVEMLYEYNCEDKHRACNIVVLKVGDVNVCLVYKPPSTPLGKSMQYISTMLDVATNNSNRIVVMGDFNVNMLNNSGNKLDKLLTSKGLINKIPGMPTTNGMTQIDLCYSNVNQLSASCFESYFSYHKPIICVIEEDISNVLETETTQLQERFSSITHEKIHDLSDTTHFKEPFTNVLGESFKELLETTQFQEPMNNSPKSTSDTEMHLNVVELEEEIIYKGFGNPDGVSCYANVVCQCILFIEPLNAAVKAANNDVIKKLLLSQIDPKQKVLSSWEIRELVDKENEFDRFTLCEQQDVPEFIDYFKNLFPAFNEITQHQLCNEFQCTNCPNAFKDNNITNNTLLPIYMRNETTSLKTMFETSYGIWEPVSRQCNECGCNALMTKTTVCVDRQCSVVFLQLMIFYHNGIEVVKKQNTLLNLHSEVIEISDIRFKVGGIISHHGTNISSGHYTCKMKSGNVWLHANDSRVVKCNEPSFETNSYVILLEKI